VVHHILTDGRLVFAKARRLELAKCRIAEAEFAPEDHQKTTVITPFGLFEYNYMPFGLCNAAQTLQRMQDQIFKDLPCTFVYLDDQRVASRDMEQHVAGLRAVFWRLADNGLAINLEKCKFECLSWIFWDTASPPPVSRRSLTVSR
jgi:hypothetical protein